MNTVLLVRGGSMGDLLVTLPAIRVLEANGYGATLAGRNEFLQIIREAALCSDAIPLWGSILEGLYAQPPDQPEQVRKLLQMFAAVVCYASADEPFSRNLASLYTGRLLIHPVPTDKLPCHISDYLLRPLLDLSIKLPLEEPRRPVVSGTIIVIHPGSGSPAKNWPKKQFFQLYKALSTNSRVMVVFGPAEESEMDFWRFNVPQEHLIRYPDARNLVALLRSAALFIGNDSGVTHLAAAMGVKTIALFGPTDPNIWAPRGPHVAVLTNKIRCSPCTREKRSLCMDRRCLTEILLPTVLDTIRSKLAAANS